MRPTTHSLINDRQRGAVLIVALVLLLVLTILGTASIRDTTMEERMAGNFRDYAAAIEAAESALRTGEEILANATTHAGMAFDGSDGTFTVSTLSVDPSGSDGWATARELEIDFFELTAGNFSVSQAPEYYIEKLPETTMGNSDLTIGTQDQPPKVRYYRVTGKGFGVSDNTEVVLQSTYFTWNGN